MVQLLKAKDSWHLILLHPFRRIYPDLPNPFLQQIILNLQTYIPKMSPQRLCLMVSLWRQLMLPLESQLVLLCLRFLVILYRVKPSVEMPR